jgi:hypothetical protein
MQALMKAYEAEKSLKVLFIIQIKEHIIQAENFDNDFGVIKLHTV